MALEPSIRLSSTTCSDKHRMEFPSDQNAFHSPYSNLLRSSFKHWTGRDLIGNSLDSMTGAKFIFEAPFALLSHHQPLSNPILNYGNKTVLALFELSWDELIQMPSRLTAEPHEREERAMLMKRVSENGYIDDYSGVRVSKSGKRFLIEQATVWNLIDSQGTYQGQAAIFSDWVQLPKNS